MDKLYDVIILGAGPAGLAAGLYSGRYRLLLLSSRRQKMAARLLLLTKLKTIPARW